MYDKIKESVRETKQELVDLKKETLERIDVLEKALMEIYEYNSKRTRQARRKNGKTGRQDG